MHMSRGFERSHRISLCGQGPMPTSGVLAALGGSGRWNCPLSRSKSYRSVVFHTCMGRLNMERLSHPEVTNQYLLASYADQCFAAALIAWEPVVFSTRHLCHTLNVNDIFIGFMWQIWRCTGAHIHITHNTHTMPHGGTPEADFQEMLQEPLGKVLIPVGLS